MIKTHMDQKYFEVLDSAADDSNYFTAIISRLKDLMILDNSLILDVGCGTGKFIAPLLKIGSPSIIGVDGPTEVACRAIGRGYKEVNVVEDLNNTKLPFANNYFDCVICKDVMEHLHNPLFTLTEIRRVLKSNGIFLFHVPHHFPLIGRLRFLFTNNLDTFKYFQNESRWDFPHLRFFEYFDVIDVLIKNGFEIVEDISYYFPAVPLLSRFKIFSCLVKYLIRRYPNQFTGAFTLILKKSN